MRGMTTTLTIGERVAWYRRKRGFSQDVFAGLIGRTEDWVSKVENNRIDLDRLSVIRSVAEALDVTLGDLLAEPSLMAWTEDSGRQTVPALRHVLMDYRQITQFAAHESLGDPPPLPQLERDVAAVWNAYQDSRFGYVTNRLVPLIPQARLAAYAHEGDNRARALGFLALTYQVAASTLTKLGEADLAWNASDRGIHAAQQSESPVVIGSLFRSVAHSLLATGAYAEAVQLTNDATEFFQPHMAKATPTLLSVSGTMLLVGAMASARRNDRPTARDFLNEAQTTASRLGGDANHLWTAFGPTNVAIHRVSTAMELGDVEVGLDLGPRVDTSPLPTERRVRHALEVSRAYSGRNRRDEALSTLLDAEQLAPEQVRYHYLSRHLVQNWIRTGRGKPSHQLSRLAKRLDVA
jgi:transcriptional regulator with XRE-family HTH domain